MPTSIDSNEAGVTAVHPTVVNNSNEPDIEMDKHVDGEGEKQNGMLSVVSWREYFQRWAGNEVGHPTCKPVLDRLCDGVLSAVGAFIGLVAVSSLHYKSEPFEGNMFVASFGASAVLIYAAPEAPLSQPWNFVFGHLLAAFTGVTVRNIFDNDADLWYITSPLACAAAVFLQHLFLCVHPPGGATAMIASSLPITTRWSGYYFLVTPVGLGVVILSAVGFLLNNIFRRRQYPHKWAAF